MMDFIMQLKFKTTGNVQPSEVREFAGTLADRPETIGFFVSNAPYGIKSKTIANNSNKKMVLCNENNIIANIKLAFNEFDQLRELEELEINDIEIDTESMVDLYGIKVNGKCKIGSLKIKKRYKPY